MLWGWRRRGQGQERGEIFRDMSALLGEDRVCGSGEESKEGKDEAVKGSHGPRPDVKRRWRIRP